MLDRTSEELLKAIIRLSKEGSFNVLSKKELAAAVCLPRGDWAERLNVSLYELKSNGLIEVRYEDDHELCLTTTPKGRLFFDGLPTRGTENARRVDVLSHALRIFEIFSGIVAAILTLSVLGVRL